MAKIFRRESIQKLKKKKTKKKENNRVRNKYVNFRVTPDEYDLLNKKVEMSGLLKQDYIIQRFIFETLEYTFAISAPAFLNTPYHIDCFF